jgi:hypothetical protein
MSHQIGAESRTLPFQMMELMNTLSEPMPAQNMKQMAPTFQSVEGKEETIE